MKTTISLLGCGWLGYPLAIHLLEQGCLVRATTTRQQKLNGMRDKGIDPYLFTISDEHIPAQFLNAEILVINIPSKDEPGFHRLRSQIEMSPIKYLIFISSTSVYDKSAGMVHEDKQLELQDHSLSRIERLFQSSSSFKTTILRFAGLVGEGRHPGRFFRGGRTVPEPGARVNLIHRDDCIGIVQAVIDQSAWGETFNACADSHPTKREFYTWATAQVGLAAPEFADAIAGTGHKIILNNKVKSQLGYQFRWPDIMQIDFNTEDAI